MLAIVDGFYSKNRVEIPPQRKNQHQADAMGSFVYATVHSDLPDAAASNI